MRSARVKVNGKSAGSLEALDNAATRYRFCYDPLYEGRPISLTMPVRAEPYLFKEFPPFFEGLLPEGVQLDALLKQEKIDRHDYFSQLVAVGNDLVGAVTVESSR
jgi:serine/threonine-protein kinase HipA